LNETNILYKLYKLLLHEGPKYRRSEMITHGVGDTEDNFKVVFPKLVSIRTT
jgi:hypothetical protein